jgi:polyisoprenoid-binding protein YceI
MSWTVDPMHTQVEFSAKHMGIMTVKGQITDVQAMIEFNEDDFTASSVAATIDARTLSTHDEQRDGHLKSPDFLDVEHFPTISFTSTGIEHAAHDQYTMTGDLTSCIQVRRRTRWATCTPASAPTRPSTAKIGG